MTVGGGSLLSVDVAGLFASLDPKNVLLLLLLHLLLLLCLDERQSRPDQKRVRCRRGQVKPQLRTTTALKPLLGALAAIRSYIMVLRVSVVSADDALGYLHGDR
jgi:hypothetical protein